MIDPGQVQDLLKTATSSLLVPTSSPSPSVAPIPTVVPNYPKYERVGDSGQTALWVVFVIMFLSTLTFGFMAFRVPVQKRLFHVLTTLITLFATLSYFAIATGDGISWHHIVIKEAHKHVTDTREHIYRQIFWARYVDWSVTTPLIFLNLAILAGLNGANILVAIIADVFMVLTGLFGAFGHNDTQKWGYYAMGCIAYLVIIYQFAVPGRRAVTSKDSSTAKFFGSIASFTLILWAIYLIVWGIGYGSRKLSVDSEIIAYAILDILAKPVFGFWLLITHARSNVARTSVEGWWSHGLSIDGGIRIEDDED